MRGCDESEVAARVFAHCIDERHRGQYEREVASLSALGRAPHVAAIIDFGLTEAGEPFLVTEFCPTGSLRDHLLAVGRLTPAETRRIGIKLAGALAEAHRRGVVHRNVRPSAVLLDAAGEPTLGGFVVVSGVPFHVMPDEALDAYRATEAYLPEFATAAMDIFGLGATLYAMVAGRPPRPIAPCTVVHGGALSDVPGVPWSLMATLRRAMAADPLDRFNCPDELAAELAA